VCSSDLNGDLSQWNLSNIKDYEDIFEDCPIETSNMPSNISVQVNDEEDKFDFTGYYISDENKIDDTKCINTCLTNFEYKKKCINHFINTLGTCWYVSVISILCFSDGVGKEFQIALFKLSEEEIGDRVQELYKKQKTHKIDVLKGDDLLNIPIILKSIKERLCIQYCDIKNLNHDMIEEQKCYFIHRKRHHLSPPTGKNNMKFSTSIGFTDTNNILVLNTLSYIVLNRMYVVNDKYMINDDIREWDKDGWIGVFVQLRSSTTGHILSVFKCNNKYIYSDSVNVREIKNITKFFIGIKNPSKDRYIKKYFEYLTEYDYGWYNGIKNIDPHQKLKPLPPLKQKMKELKEQIKNNESLNDVELTEYSNIDNKVEGRTLLEWAIIYKNEDIVNKILKSHPENIKIPGILDLAKYSNNTIFKKIENNGNTPPKQTTPTKQKSKKNVFSRLVKGIVNKFTKKKKSKSKNKEEFDAI
jgi:hypothetical protein